MPSSAKRRGAAGVAILGSLTRLATLSCRHCARRTVFEQPPCPDGHDEDCPEWYCTECGAATLIGWTFDGGELRRTARSSRAGSRRSRVA